MKVNTNSHKKASSNSKSTVIVFIVLCIALVGIALTILIKNYGETIAVAHQQKENSTAQDGSEIIDISEKLYVSWFNEIAADPEKYLGKTIRLEGMFDASTISGKTYYNVYRNYSGACPLCNAATLGFEFTTDDGKMPEENDWIEVSGTLERYQENSQYYYTLSHAVWVVKQERGLETVLN